MLSSFIQRDCFCLYPFSTAGIPEFQTYLGMKHPASCEGERGVGLKGGTLPSPLTSSLFPKQRKLREHKIKEEETKEQKQSTKLSPPSGLSIAASTGLALPEQERRSCFFRDCLLEEQAAGSPWLQRAFQAPVWTTQDCPVAPCAFSFYWDHSLCDAAN